MTALPPLIEALLEPRCYDHPVERVTLVETHISWVLLTGTIAYKIKKPIDLGFLDFSTLDKRRFCCEEELRLNRRLAPQLYLAVVPITGLPQAPILGGPGQALEYAVKMLQFAPDQELDKLLAHGDLAIAHIEDLANQLADFHGHIDIAGTGSPWGTPEHVWQPVAENFEQIRARLPSGSDAELAQLEAWSTSTFTRLEAVIAARKEKGFVRECHGDAHLANMVLLEGRVVLFDCIEFNPNLRWIDVMSEVAFLVMDLDDRSRPDLARLVLNDYLAHTGDYPGLALLRFYQVYRALVRAKVAAIRLSQPDLGPIAAQATQAEFASYLQLAISYTRPRPAPLIITHGPSGAGKTCASRQLIARIDAIHLRSDVERKRLHGLGALERSQSAPGGGLYTAQATEQTYQRLAELADTILDSGLAVIVDATFLHRRHRELFRAIAARHGARFVILDLHAPEPVLRARVLDREQQARDASEAGVAVLTRQLASAQPLDDSEEALAISLSTANVAQTNARIGEFARTLLPP